ncbi:GNAT family N-acetyltransferase [Xenorhabdus cabanillasii]|uniref:Broad specificity phosphatase PhoE n=2 Tax=Xenorhabdus cabanillasii TaxID=351673 RepID=A0A3D9UG51_9GAMM|nr:GNAT family N-acetyltransferase [Xenorhabdus cabanillasii]PHM77438.1 GNAT family N-acetyltransferase [Xenorhabdus cabanillasii JM26]REF28448.1 broad specificity phosphatase PhoE [Xenorhabdus cabanillasii]CDL79656.1 Acetyltransferase, gnat family (modular protein) [Xenorhabdus cabanillasii JM26]
MLELKQVTPQSPLWNSFLHLYGEYFQRYWPDVFGDLSEEAMAKENHTALEQRILQGDRGLFLLLNAGQLAGLANVYLEREEFGQEEKVTLNIAEFYIRDEYQRQKLGHGLWHAMLQWGRRHGATQVHLETDVGKSANFFWQSHGLSSHQVDERVHYHGPIPPLKILWLRHGQIIPLDHLDYCPEDNLIALDATSIKQAKEIGIRILGKLPWQTIYTSPQRRAFETAKALSSANKSCLIQETEALCEFFPEELIGMKLADIPHRYGEDYAHRLLYTPLDSPFKNSEQVTDAANRIHRFIMQMGDELSMSSMRMIVSHQNLHNIFLAHLMTRDLNLSGRWHLNHLHGSTFLYCPYTKQFDVENVNIPL